MRTGALWPRLALLVLWVCATAPFVGVVVSCLSAFGMAAIVEIVRYAIDVVAIWNDPLNALSPTDHELSKHR